ncbi:MAG: hypothetical protein AAB243_03815 [Planctomycetota bacterium]|nr:hypothetical protein [Syntrophales bacterium]MDP1992273.1 hypothetical protein [Syntrophales bacterium]
MLIAKKLMVPSSEEVRSEAVQTLIKRMGITKAAIFIRETMSQKTDYLKAKDELFAGKSADQLYEEIRKR